MLKYLDNFLSRKMLREDSFFKKANSIVQMSTICELEALDLIQKKTQKQQWEEVP